MTSRDLCFQRHSRQWDKNDFLKRSNVLNFHEHQSARSHITRSEFWAYATTQRKYQFRLWVIPVSALIAGLLSTLPTHVKFTISSKYQLICCISTSLNKRDFSNNPLSNQRLPFVFHWVSMATITKKKLVSKRKCSSQHQRQTDASPQICSDGLPFK